MADLLQTNLRLNGVDDLVRVDRRAVDSFSGAALMRSMVDHSESNSLHDFRKYYPHQDLAICRAIETVSIDDFVQERHLKQSLFVKLDAEGHDWPALKGMAGVLGEKAPAILIEFAPRYLNEYGNPAQLLYDLSKDYWLLSTQLLEVYCWACEIVSENELDEFTNRVAESPIGWTDVLALWKGLPDVDVLIEKLLSGSRQPHAGDGTRLL